MGDTSSSGSATAATAATRSSRHSAALSHGPAAGEVHSARNAGNGLAARCATSCAARKPHHGLPARQSTRTAPAATERLGHGARCRRATQPAAGSSTPRRTTTTGESPTRSPATPPASPDSLRHPTRASMPQVASDS